MQPTNDSENFTHKKFSLDTLVLLQSPDKEVERFHQMHSFFLRQRAPSVNQFRQPSVL